MYLLFCTYLPPYCHTRQGPPRKERTTEENRIKLQCTGSSTRRRVETRPAVCTEQEETVQGEEKGESCRALTDVAWITILTG